MLAELLVLNEASRDARLAVFAASPHLRVSTDAGDVFTSFITESASEADSARGRFSSFTARSPYRDLHVHFELCVQVFVTANDSANIRWGNHNPLVL
jgi:hypothetical protein